MARKRHDAPGKIPSFRILAQDGNPTKPGRRSLYVDGNNPT